MIAPGVLHVGAAVLVLVLGIVLFAGPKGSMRHRRFGFAYLGSMVYVNASAWMVDTDGSLGPFHYLTVLSLATIAGAYLILMVGPTGRGRSEAHGIMMAWSYVGVVAAGLGQGAAVIDASVWVTIVTTLTVAAVLIHLVRPSVLRVAA